MRTPRTLTAVLAVAVLASLATACGSSGDGASSAADAGGGSTTTAAATDAFPISIDHAFGTTEIDEAPERVVTWGWGSTEAAISMGIPVKRVKMACFVICSMLAGFAGTIQVFRLQSPLPSIGESLELQAVAAAVIGGVSLTGGVGTVFGAVVGALLIRIIDNGLVLSRIDANWFKFAIGALTILAVVGNSWLRRTARQIKVEA